MGWMGVLFMAVIMAGGVLEAEAQSTSISFDFIKNYLNMQDDEALQKRIDEFQELINEKYNSADERLKKLAEAVKQNDLDKMEPVMLRTLSKAEVERMASLGGLNLPERLLEEFDRFNILKLTDQEVVNTVREKMADLDPAQISALMTRLGSVTDWSAKNITDFGVSALQLPVCLDDTGDKKVLQEVLNLINTCESNNPAGCPKSSALPALRRHATMRFLGSPKNWKASDLDDVRLNEVPPFMVHQLSDTFIEDMEERILKNEGDEISSEIQENSESWMTALCRVKRCDDMSASRTKEWRRELPNKLRVLVTPSDVSSEARKDATLMAELEENAANMKRLRAKDAAILLDMKMNKENPDSISKIGGKLAAWAPACYLAEAAEKKELSSVRNDMATTLDLVRGPEYKAKVREAMKAEMEAAVRNNDFTISSVNDYLKPYIRPTLLIEQHSGTLLNLAKKAEENYINLTPHQMQVVASKLSSSDSQKCPASLCESLPSSFLENLRSDYLANIDRELFGVTLPCLFGAKDKFTGKSTLTPSDIENGKAFLKCMSYEDANKVKESEIFDVFRKLKTEALSWPACRALNMKLMKWAENNLNNTDEGGVIEKLYISELDDVPPCVAILSEPALYELTTEKKKVVLNNLCKAKNYFTIPKEARSKVVNSFLSDTMTGPITECGLRRMKGCFYDLSPSMMRKMDEAAAMSYLEILETSIKKGTPDCLDSARMDEVADMMIRVKGPVRTWRTADDVSCILETFPTSSIDSVVSDLPAEVLITTGCPMRAGPYMTIPSNCREAKEKAMKSMRNRRVETCSRLRETYGTKNRTCDSLMCGSAVRISQSQLERMRKEDVMMYLDDLITEDLDTKKAKVILTKVKETKQLKDMSTEELARLKYAFRGLSKQDVRDLPALNFADHQEVVYQLGSMTDSLPDDVMIQLRDKLLQDKTPESLTAVDTFMLGNIMCYLTKEQIMEIPTKVIKKSLRSIGQLDCSNPNATYNLAEAVKQANGKVENWDAALVREMGRLISGLRPEDLSDLPKEAYIGITPEGMKKIDPDTIKVMIKDQANNLDGSTAAAVTSEQVRLLPNEVRSALSNAKSEELRSGASGVLVPGVTAAAGAAAAAALVFLL